jgi:hypothetical protein
MQSLPQFFGGPWDKRTLVGQKAPLKVKDVWAIRVRLLQIQVRARHLAPFEFVIRPIRITSPLERRR